MNFEQIKNQILNFYRKNKLITYLIICDLVLISLLGGSLFEAIINAYLVYFGGTIFKYYLDDRKMINVVVGGAILGGLITFLVFPELPIPFIIKSMLTAGSMAIFVAAATYIPNMEVMLFFLGKVKIKWIAVAFVLLDILNMNTHYPNSNIGDIGGILFGFMLIYIGKNKSFTSTPAFLKWFMRPRGPYYKKPQKKKASSSDKRAESDEDYNSRKNKEQDEIDAILDKIKERGYDSLSAEEKKQLFDKSKNG